MKKVIIFLIIFVSLLIFGGIFFRQKNIEAKRAALYLQDQREAGYEVLQQIVRHERRLAAIVEQGEPYVERAEQIVREVTGRSLEEKPPAARQSELMRPQPVEPSTPDAPAAAPPPRVAPAPRRPAPQPDVDRWDGGGVPPGMPTREELDRMRQRQGAPRPEPQAAEPESVPAETGTTEPAPPPPMPSFRRPAERVEEVPPILKRGRDMLEVRGRLLGLRNDMAELVSKATGLQNQLNRTVDGPSAAALVAALREEAGFAEAKIMDGNSLIEDMRRIESDLEDLSRRAERERREREEAEQARRAAEEHTALIARERERVKTTHEMIKADLQRYDFAKALETINQLMENLQTEEARRDLVLHRERYELLVNFKNFLIEQINAHPFRWGWVQDVGQKDVLQANQETIRVTDRVVPWEEIELVQFLRIINHYITRPDARTREKGDGNLAAAILCYELGRTDLMDRFKSQALNLAPYLADTANRLLP